MSSVIFESDTWPTDITALLDDHHLVAVSDKPEAQKRFADGMREYMRSITDNLVVTIHGSRVESMQDFCGELQRYVPGSGGPLHMPDVIELFRSWPGLPRRLYVLWRDADVTIDADVHLFSRLVNTLFALAVEHEHLNPNRLVLLRAVFIGGSKLGAYAEDDGSQFSRWLTDQNETSEDEDALLWEAQSCVERPPVLTYRIDG